MRVILKETGSIYLHCDPTASHYIKVMMDAIFDHRNFQNEIVWKRTSAHVNPKRWGPVHDVILFYTKSDKFTWNTVHQPYDKEYLEVKYKHEDEKGHYRLSDLTGAGWGGGDSGKDWQGFSVKEIGRHWAVPKDEVAAIVGADNAAALSTQEKLDALNAHGFIYWTPRGKYKDGRGFPQFKRYLTGGVPVQDVVSDISPINSQAKERLGYPTQKPIALLERIIRASSNEGDVVFDPFCGCGTTIYAAERTHRQWIGCDIAILSVNLVRDVLEAKHRLVNGVHFEVDGIPVSVEQAQALFKRDPFQFQHWFVEKVGGFPTKRMTGDKGIDGRLYFETKDGLREVVLSVKGGKIRPTDVRDLRGVLEREPDAAIGGLLSLQEPSKAMCEEAARAGMYEYSGNHYPRIQFLTAKDILEDKREFHTPTKLGSRAKSGQASFAYDPVQYSD
jgi:DNA modification methylase